jgi:hypothetical protein
MRRFPWLDVGILAGWVIGVIAVVAIAVVAWTACCGWRSAAISDVAQPTSLTLLAHPQDYFPHGMPSGVSVWVTGEVKGSAEMWTGNWKRQEISGRVDWSEYHDWFDNQCVLQYKPIGPVSGQLVIRYMFH